MPGAIAFQRAFALLVRRRCETFGGLARALADQGCLIDRGTLRLWAEGAKTPAHARSFAALAALEARWGLPVGYFRALLPPPAGSSVRAGGSVPTAPSAPASPGTCPRTSIAALPPSRLRSSPESAA